MNLNEENKFVYLTNIGTSNTKNIYEFRVEAELNRAKKYGIYKLPERQYQLEECAYCGTDLYRFIHKCSYKFCYINTPLIEYFLCETCASKERTHSDMIYKIYLYFYQF